MAQSAYVPEPVPAGEPSFDVLGWFDRPWTARLALDLLPETNGPKVEVLSGSVIVSPHAGIDHQSVERDLSYLLHRAARQAGLWVYPEVNIVSGDNLFIPDIAVLSASGAGRASMDISAAVLLGEIVSRFNRRKDVIERPREYAAAKVPFYLRVDLRHRRPAMALFELAGGEYRPLVTATAGTTFVMDRPFAFAIDPAELLDDAGPDDAGPHGAGPHDAGAADDPAG